MIVLLAATLALPPAVELAAVGDVMPGRYVGRRIDREGLERVLGPAALRRLRSADIAFGNLECPLTVAPFLVRKRIRLRARPAMAASLAKVGFDVLSVANNHALDCGVPGLKDTVEALRAAGIRQVGASDRAVVVRRNGLAIAFLAYCDFPGPCGIRYSDERTFAAEISVARKGADVVVVSWHWGVELSPDPSDRQRRLARHAAAAGADAILGHHPHVWQPIEWLPGPAGRRCLVAYSLGNFLFDGRTAAERRRAILRLTLNRGGVRTYEVVETP